MEELVGCYIWHLYLDPTHSRLIFVTATGTVAYDAIGDCCSSSWFNDILGVDALLEGVVASVETVDLDPWTEGGSVLRAYAVKIVTDRGRAEIIFRNESNGYYGGWASYVGPRTVTFEMLEITADWSADD